MLELRGSVAVEDLDEMPKASVISSSDLDEVDSSSAIDRERLQAVVLSFAVVVLTLAEEDATNGFLSCIPFA